MKYLSCRSLFTKRRQTVCYSKPFSLRNPPFVCIPCFTSYMHEAFQYQGWMWNFRDVLHLFGLTGLFSNDELHGMLEGKDYQCIDMALLIIVGYVDIVSGYKKLAVVTKS